MDGATTSKIQNIWHSPPINHISFSRHKFKFYQENEISSIWDPMSIFLNVWSCLIIPIPLKVKNCSKSAKNIKIYFSRQKFKFDFLAPKLDFDTIFQGTLLPLIYVH